MDEPKVAGPSDAKEEAKVESKDVKLENGASETVENGANEAVENDTGDAPADVKDVKEEPSEGATEKKVEEAEDHVVTEEVIEEEVDEAEERAKNADPELLRKVEQLIESDVYDTEAWITLVIGARQKQIGEARATHEKFLEHYPTASRYWKNYADHEMEHENYDKVEKIFGKCLLTCLNVELWRCYLDYVRKTKAEGTPKEREEICESYEFALENVGMDPQSSYIWNDYIAFVKALPVENDYEKSQKMTQLRKLYQRAVCQPIQNVEVLWKEYDAFEQNLNKMLAAQLLKDHSAKYMTARTVFRELKNKRDGLNLNLLARPRRGVRKEEEQLLQWKRLIEYEATNPLRLTQEQLRLRVTFVYRQCLLCFRHYPEVWHECASYQLEKGSSEQAEEFHNQSLKACPNNTLLHFAYSDFLESQQRADEAITLFEKLVDTTPDPLIYIKYQQVARRVKGMAGARSVFSKARKNPDCSWHSYVASALMEYRVNKNKDVARNVFEMGLSKGFLMEPAYVLQYIEFMSHLNDEGNLRGLFERVLNVLPAEKSFEIWNRYLAFEYQHGDLASIQKVEKRRAEKYPEVDGGSLYRLVHRSRFLDLWPCSVQDMEAFSRTASMKMEDVVQENKAREEMKAKKERDAALAALKVERMKFPRPEIARIPEYDPTTPAINHGEGSGGIAPNVPDVLHKFIANLPAQHLYNGPPPNVDLVMSALLKLPDEPPAELGIQLDSSNNQGKRKKGHDSDSDDEPASSRSAAPKNDIYKARLARQEAKRSKR